MTKLLLIVALWFSTSAIAQTKEFTALKVTPVRIKQMLATCEKEMEAGFCSVIRDEKNYPPNTPGPVIAGFGRVPLIPYIRLQNQQGAMCPYADYKCSTEPNGDVCKTALALWGR